jgi:RNA polymerase sigma factor (sigma-70 family)
VTDEELLEAWRNGDRAAGNDLFERHFDALYRFFERKMSGDAGDLVQRAFLALVEGRDRFRGDASVRTYLYAIARHELMRHWREKRRAADLDFGVSSVHDFDPSPSEAAQKRQADRVLLEALRRIPLDLQIAIELHYFESIRGPELARILEIPEGTVRSRLRRGLELLQAKAAELASSKDALRSTLTDLDRWAAELAKQR